MSYEERQFVGNMTQDEIYARRYNEHTKLEEMSRAEAWEAKGIRHELSDPVPTAVRNVQQLKAAGFVGVTLIQECAGVRPRGA